MHMIYVTTCITITTDDELVSDEDDIFVGCSVQRCWIKMSQNFYKKSQIHTLISCSGTF